MTRPGRRFLPIIVLLVGLVASLAAALAVAQAEKARQRERFAGLADNAIGAVEARILAQLTLLRGTAGFFNAEPELGRDEFRAYVARLRLAEFYPGVLGIGFAAYGTSPETVEAEALRIRGGGSFRLWPEGTRQGYSAIVFLEPMNRLNEAAIGFDMMSEPTRRAAMTAAHRDRIGRTSGRVRLVQEIDPVKQPGFLIYLPVYHEAGPRRGALRGWVYSPLRAYDLFGAVFADHPLAQIHVEIFDETEDEENLLYRSGAPDPEARHRLVRNVDIAGRTWAIRVSSAEGFEPGSAFTPAVVGVAGALISLLIAALLLQQIRSALATERQVAARTAELREANERLVGEAAARESVEAQMRQMQKMEAVGQLTGGIAHDFNNMLAVVLGNIDMAERRLDEPDRLKRALANARTGAERAADLTRRLLAFGRQQALKPQVIDPNQLIASMLELLRRVLGEAITVRSRAAPDLWPVHADSSQLENAILNIAINARDAMPAGGELWIETANRVIAEEEARRDHFLAPGEHVMIAIADSGHGMPPDVVARAMDPFFTTKAMGKGTGLGLSQVFGFIQQSGGHVRIESEVGSGTRVLLYLPRAREAVSEPVAEAPADLPRARPGEVVLVVEDEAQLREISEATLSDLGYAVVSAANGAEALERMERMDRLDLLLTDIVMPVMDGRKLAEAAKARRPGLKLLFTTGYAPEGLIPEGALRLDKPFQTPDLARKVREAIDAAD